MPRRPYPFGCWPTDAQRLLLRACLLEGDAGRAAWHRWRAAHSLEALDAGSFRLLGLLYRNLGRLGVRDDPALPRLRGVYRYFWSRHQMTFAGTPALLAALGARGIPTMILKGAALTLSVYRDPGVRPMEDLDLLVPERLARAAMATLESRGLRPAVPGHERLVGVDHACLFEQDPERTVDLHWRLLRTDPRPHPDDEFWADARELVVGGEPSRILSPADQLLHTAEHGVRHDPIPPLRWLADAATIVRVAGPALDWSRLVRQALAHEVVLPARATLEYLSDELDVDVPASVLAELARARVSWLVRAEHALAQRPVGASVAARLPVQLCVYVRRRRGAGWGRALRDLPQYLRVMNGIHRPWPAQARWVAAQATGAVVWRWRRWWRGRGAPLPGMAGVVVHAGRGLHQPERWRGRPFRWTRPAAAVRCQLAPDAYTVRLDLGGLRRWAGDLEGHLALWFNQTPVSPEWIDAAGDLLSFPIDRQAFVPGPLQMLRVTCPTLSAGPDPRPLGLPLFGLSFEPVSGRPTLHGVHGPERWRGRTFRWSRPSALLRWRDPPVAHAIRLDLGGLRPWPGDLERSLRLRLDGAPVPPAAIEPTPAGIAVRLEPGLLARDPVHTLRLECAPAPAPGDSRLLGLPVFGIDVDAGDPRQP